MKGLSSDANLKLDHFFDDEGNFINDENLSAVINDMVEVINSSSLKSAMWILFYFSSVNQFKVGKTQVLIIFGCVCQTIYLKKYTLIFSRRDNPYDILLKRCFMIFIFQNPNILEEML